MVFSADPPASQPASRPTSQPASPDILALPVITELPNPFLFQDGSPVKSSADWQRRRGELIELFLRYEYGHPPMSVTAVSGKETERTDNTELHASVTLITLRIAGEAGLTVPLVLTAPAGNGPFPVIVTGELGWGAVKPEVAAMIVGRGYALCEFDRTLFAADAANRKRGVYVLDPSADCGAIAAWAWGYSRVIDYVTTRSDLDVNKIIASRPLAWRQGRTVGRGARPAHRADQCQRVRGRRRRLLSRAGSQE